MNITIGNTDCNLLFVSRSGCTIIKLSLARQIRFNCIQATWSKIKPLDFKSFPNDTVETLGTLTTPTNINDWQFLRAKILVVGDGLRPFPGRNLFDQLGRKITQKSCPKVEINNIDLPRTTKQSIAKEFPELITRIDKSKHHTVNSKFHRNHQVAHQNGQKIPFYLKPKVTIELENLLTEGHIKNLSNCFYQFFISP